MRNFWDLFIAASMPVLKVLLVTGLGSVLALERFDLLGEDARKHMNNIVFYVFNPCLVSSSLANSITYKSMIKMWFMPLNIFITFVIGSILGVVVVQVTRAPQHLRGLIVGCCAAGNLGNMLIIIIPAVCKEKGSPFGDPDICHTYGMGYASLSMAIGAIYLWSYVYNIIRISSSRSSKEIEIIHSPLSKSHSPLERGSSTELILPSNDCITEKEEFSEQKTSFGAKAKQYLEMLSRKINLKSILAPSTTGAIVGFIVGLTPEIRKLLIGDAAPLHVIQDTALLLGDGSIPAVTLIMGANLLKGLRGSSSIDKTIIIGIIVARYIVLPITGIAIVKGAIHFGIVAHDPLYQFVLYLQYAVPPAMNIGTMTQLFGAGESECSVIMLWAYGLASVSLTMWSTFYMWLVSS
ncbi:unnamed protein product [Cuscuta epithymum]|uniref:Protein PIN-LIKES 3-like n=1 Tax=Cuscuta epithymum TaxID=186058 RepID=A0AAV0GBF1_9ASTE|nr:unnamed protein product [Cuscuta epithymum]CAH9145292.1 unnamed protein product [Cuscuta epithymum]